MFYRLFCVAYDMNGSSLGKIAFMEMKYSINTASAISKPISLTKYSVIDEDTEETTYYCKFNVDEIYKITIGNSIVATNYGLTGTNNEDFGTVLFPEGSENFENGSLVGDKYVLKMKNGDATGNLGTISLKCEARWGVKIGNVFVPIKIAQDSSVIGEIEEVYDNFEITINYVLYLGEIEPDDGPEPEPEPVVPGDGGDPDGGDDDPDDDYEEGLEPD